MICIFLIFVCAKAEVAQLVEHHAKGVRVKRVRIPFSALFLNARTQGRSR